MALDLASEIWSELKRHISTVDRNEAADALVAVLVDNDFDASEIKLAFKNDSAINNALRSYLDEMAEDLIEIDNEDFDPEE